MPISSKGRVLMGEFELLQTIYDASKNLGCSVTIGPGDDMGEIVLGGKRLLLAVDQLHVGRHVELDCAPEAIGRKAIARCFSDIAAMCGFPVCSLMTACLPTPCDDQWATRVFSSAKAHAEQWGGPIIGGDIATSDCEHAMFTVTALATPSEIGAVKRVGAQLGDLVCVTGELGNSIEGHHLTFEPRIKLAQTIQHTLGVDLHSMIDISDGLAQDAGHLASDGCSIQLDASSLPLRSGATIEAALGNGEDYELLFTCTKQPPIDDVTVIGNVVERGDSKVIDEAGNAINIRGWAHE